MQGLAQFFELKHYYPDGEMAFLSRASDFLRIKLNSLTEAKKYKKLAKGLTPPEDNKPDEEQLRIWLAHQSLLHFSKIRIYHIFYQVLHGQTNIKIATLLKKKYITFKRFLLLMQMQRRLWLSRLTLDPHIQRN